MTATKVIQIKQNYNKNLNQMNLLISDLHLDSDYCQKSRLTRHLNQALEHDARIFINGDLFDAMQGKKDFRSAKNEMKGLNLSTAYFNDIIERNTEFLRPYAKNIEMIGYGNHETSIIRHNDIDVLDILCSNLNVKKAAYEGFIRWQFTYNGKGNRKSFDLYYWHGNGGNAPMTGGIIESKRATIRTIADIYWAGHNHERYDFDNEIQLLNQAGFIETKTQTLIRSGSYKREISEEGYGFGVEKGIQNKPIGGWWLRFYCIDSNVTFQTIKTD